MRKKRFKALKATICRFEVESDNANGSNSRFKVPRIDQNGVTPKKSRVSKYRRSWAKRSAKFELSPGKVLVDLPLRTKSEANCFEPWRVKYARHQEQKRAVALALTPAREQIRLPCRIMLTRYAPDELDVFDNLPVSFKYIVDAVCSIITGEYRAGKADSDKRITIACDQEKSKEYGIRIEITY